MQTEISKK